MINKKASQSKILGIIQSLARLKSLLLKRLSLAIVFLIVQGAVALPAHAEYALPAAKISNSQCREYVEYACKLSTHNHYQAALQYSELALRADKNCSGAHLQKGYLLMCLEKPLEALPELRIGFKLDPTAKDGWAYKALAQALFETGKNKEAFDVLQRGLLVTNDKALLYNFRGRLHDQKDELQPAIDDFTKAINCSESKEYYTRGQIYMRMKQYQKALDDFNLAIKQSPDHAYFFSCRALAYKALGRTKNFEQDTLKARQLSTGSGLGEFLAEPHK